LSPYLFPHQPLGQTATLGVQPFLGIDAPEEIEEERDEPRPARLVAGPEARAVVAVEILVEQNEIAPVRVVLELRAAAVDGPSSLAVAEERR